VSVYTNMYRYSIAIYIYICICIYNIFCKYAIVCKIYRCTAAGESQIDSEAAMAGVLAVWLSTQPGGATVKDMTTYLSKLTTCTEDQVRQSHGAYVRLHILYVAVCIRTQDSISSACCV
jgi:hypothetical protein